MLKTVLIFGLLDIVAYVVLEQDLQARWYPYLEIPLTLAFTVALGWFLSRSFKAYFDNYLLDAAFRNGRKTNSEFLVLARFGANAGILLILVVAFAETHSLNIFGLVASLGVGGIAVAFAAQKVLEQTAGGAGLFMLGGGGGGGKNRPLWSR